MSRTRKFFDALPPELFRTNRLPEGREAPGRCRQRLWLLAKSKPDEILPSRGLSEKTAAGNCSHTHVLHQKPREFDIVCQTLLFTQRTNVAHDVIRAAWHERLKPRSIQRCQQN